MQVDIHESLMRGLGASLVSDTTITSDGIQAHYEGKQETLAITEMTQGEHEANEMSEDEFDEINESMSHIPRSGWGKIKLIPLVSWFIRMLSFGLGKTTETCSARI